MAATEVSRFWTGTTPGDAGPYTADLFSDVLRYLLLGSDNESGPIYASGTAPDFGLTVQQTGAPSTSVQVTPGAALVYGGYYNLSGGNQVFAISANGSGNPRIDTIVLRKDWTLQTIRLVLLTGTPAGSPLPPGLTQTPGVRYEIPLADIAVASGFVTIVTANITPRRAWANMPANIVLENILNNTGNVLVAGDVVVWDTTADFAVKTSTTANDITVAGVWLSRTGAGSYGRVLVKGIGPVNANAAVTRGNVLSQSTSAKQAGILSTAGLSQGVFAQALQTTTGAGLVTCYVDATLQNQRIPNSASLIREAGADYNTTSAVFADVDAANLILNVSTSTGRIAFEIEGSLGSNASTDCELDVIVDSTTRYGSTNGMIRLGTGCTQNQVVSAQGRFTGLSIGSHTLKLQFRAVTGGNTCSLRNNAYPINMRAWEV